MSEFTTLLGLFFLRVLAGVVTVMVSITILLALAGWIFFS